MPKQSKTRFPEKLLVSMPSDMRRQVSEKASKSGQTATEFIRSAIRQAIAATPN